MFARNLFLVGMVTAGSLNLTGCRGEAAPSPQPQRSHARPSIDGLGRNTSQAAPASGRAHHLQGDTSRDTFLSTYRNPEQGISIRFPRNYSLQEGEVQEHSFLLKRQEDLGTEQPGATLLATVLIPEDGYPNTTFEHGSLQLVVNEAETEKECRDLSFSGFDAIKSGTTTIQGVVFRWSEQESDTAGTRVIERIYVGYKQGTCYEFLVTLAAEQSPDPDGFKKPLDSARIMRQLEKIVSSAQVAPKVAPPPAETSAEASNRL